MTTKTDEESRPTLDAKIGETGACRGCGAAIIWGRTRKGRLCPYNPDGTSHFTTCPKAATFSRKKAIDAH